MNLFTYGSLMFPEVWAHVTCCECAAEPAVLEDASARELAGECYPVLVEEAGAVCAGRLYYDVGAEVLATLDSFEGDYYIRRTVTVQVGEDAVLAEVYWANPASGLPILTTRWDAEVFRRDHLAGFLASYAPH